MRHEPVQFCMLDEPDCNDPFDCIPQECQIENWSIGIHVFRIEIRLFQPWAKFKAFNTFGELPSPSDMLHIFVIVPGFCQIRHQSFDEPCWSWVQHAVFHRSLARSLTSSIRWSVDHVRPQNQDCDNRSSGYLLLCPSVWNSLPGSLRYFNLSLEHFRRKLKLRLFIS